MRRGDCFVSFLPVLISGEETIERPDGKSLTRGLSVNAISFFR